MDIRKIGMLNKKVVLPNYNGRNFINIISTIEHVFGIDDCKQLLDDKILDKIHGNNKIVFLLVDAFGWKTYNKFKNNSKVFKEIQNNGVVEKITSQFPSTTTAHITTVATGQGVSTHGFFEWYTYDPDIDQVFTPFLYNYEINKDILPKDNLFKKLQEVRVKTTIINPSYINNSSFSKELLKANRVLGYNDADDMFNILTDLLINDREKNFYFIYYPYIDSIAHEYGINSNETHDEIIYFLENFDKNIFKLISEKTTDTTFIISADHGQIEIDVENKIYLNRIFPEISKYFICKKNGDPIVPVGYNRDMVLYVIEEKLDELIGLLQKLLYGKADVVKTIDLIDNGVFVNPSKDFCKRIGNIIILPYDNYGVWWYDKGNSEILQVGSHGGLSPDEMEIPLLIYNFKSKG